MTITIADNARPENDPSLIDGHIDAFAFTNSMLSL
jgi:hypothetical protein